MARDVAACSTLVIKYQNDNFESIAKFISTSVPIFIEVENLLNGGFTDNNIKTIVLNALELN